MTLSRKSLSALKHGAYSATTLLPGESAAAFEKLHQELISEWSPNGALEHDVVDNLAHLLWRRRNLGTFRVAALVQRQMRRLRDDLVSTIDIPKSNETNDFDKVFNKKCHAAETKARKQLGEELYALAEMSDEATLDHLKKELDVEERLNAMIERCIKTLMLARGLKSMSITPASVAPETLPSPAKAA